MLVVLRGVSILGRSAGMDLASDRMAESAWAIRDYLPTDPQTKHSFLTLDHGSSLTQSTTTDRNPNGTKWTTELRTTLLMYKSVAASRPVITGGHQAI